MSGLSSTVNSLPFAACYLLIAAPAVLLVFARAAAHLDEHVQAQSCPRGAVAKEGKGLEF